MWSFLADYKKIALHREVKMKHKYSKWLLQIIYLIDIKSYKPAQDVLAAKIGKVRGRPVWPVGPTGHTGLGLYSPSRVKFVS